ncbi:hypothetical protein J4E82_010723 [Alternaria postmessia]|uniref:uncharacterized protein n=1 Tax=Alternaria postmessia TaxID=1187938 RepID=UPI0022259329|nr:uncharacterized protein J4E82_010723 [Alternaria postmessia]KAI5368466.1 hypothetical protein J4E82_010723 [Alternaria postmessia]
MASQGMDENYCAKDWCFIESQTWVGSDYVRYDPEICFVENPPEICEDTSFDPDIIDSTLQSVVGLYEPDLYCDECFLKIWRQRLLSPFLTTGDWTQFRIDAFEELQSNCSIHMPYVTSDYSLFVGTPTATPTATSAIHIPPACTFDLASGQYICPTASTSCTGQIVEANPELRGCSAIADEFHVSTGDLRVATGNDFCAFQEQICLPLPCTTIEITKYDETCSDMVKQISNSTHRVTQEQFMGWNPHLMGPCDSMALGQRICVRYDQEAHLCIVCPSIHDADEIFEQKIWYPLETALEFWLGQVRKGRIATPHEGENEDLVNERYDPWQFIPYNDTMLEENVDAFNRLVEAIEARMPSAYRPAEAEGIVHGLVDESALQSIDLPPRFAYKFLCRARRPRFQMIAPGLEILTSSTFSDQPFRSYFSSSEPEFPPILLFRSGSNYKDDTTPHFVTGEPMPSLFTGFSRITCFPAGLYLLPTGEVRAEDECMLILPFGIGSNGYARKSDGSRFGRSRTGGNSHVDLYRPGYQPFEEQHEQSLVDVLKNWKGMVERGDWQIDENGVAGGMDVWREADSEEKWEAYVIPRAVEGVER